MILAAAAAEELSVDANIAAVLSETDGIFGMWIRSTEGFSWWKMDFISISICITDTDINTAYDAGTYRYAYLHYSLLFGAKSRHDGIKTYLAFLF